jgi:peptidoglycan/LPS O-acetylase OafA/YrhL
MNAPAAVPSGVFRPKRIARIDDIEALRAVAIILTMIGHIAVLIPVPTFASDTRYFAWSGGVDLFLVISGFVITKSMLRYIDTDKRRLLPAAWFWLAMSLITVAFFNASTAFGKFWPIFYDAIAAVLQLANINVYSCNVLMMQHCAPGGIPNGIYWSLSLEEQFYLLFPFFVCFLPRRLFILAFVAIVLAQLFNDKIGLQWFLKTDGISIGVLIALVGQKGFYGRLEPTFLRSGWVRCLATTVFCLLLAVAASGSVRSIPYTGGMTVIVSGLWVFCASFDK